MLINKHNLTIAELCATESHKTFITNALQFTKSGTLAINGCYSVAVSALQTSDKEAIGCINNETLRDLKTQATGGDIAVDTSLLPFIAGRAPIIELPDNPVRFEITLNASLLLKLAESACAFDEDSILRIQFTGENDPVRMDARNTKTGQKWEAFLMPRKLGKDTERFAEQLRQAEARQKPFLEDGVTPNRQAMPSVDDPLAAALAEAQKLAGL